MLDCKTVSFIFRPNLRWVVAHIASPLLLLGLSACDLIDVLDTLDFIVIATGLRSVSALHL